MRTLILLLILVIANGPYFNISAQAKTNEGSGPIVLEITVVDRYGRNVTGLKAENFKIYDEKEIKPVSLFSTETRPASIGILVDTSGSMSRLNMAVASEELIRFVSEGSPNDEYFVFTFSESFRDLVGFNKDKQVVKAALKQVSSIEPQQNTRLYDAIKVGWEKMESSSYSKKALVVLGDSSDNSSKMSFDKLKDLLRESDISFYNLARPNRFDSTSFGESRTITDIEYLAAMSGGRSYYFGSTSELRENLTRVNLALQTRYVVGFSPTEGSVKKKRDWRKVKVKIDYPQNRDFEKGLIVSAREGYYAPVR